MKKLTQGTIWIVLLISSLTAVLLLTACNNNQELSTQESGASTTKQTPAKNVKTPPANEKAITESAADPNRDNLSDAVSTQNTIELAPAGAEREFKTDFSKHSVPYDEILSGGPPKDGIPAIDSPRFVTVQEAEDWLKDREPVVFVKINGEARAYPLQILTWHEIVNDRIDDIPVAVTFCPLCNTAVAFESLVKGQPTTFGTTGRLRYSNLIMYDRLTESWWQQATGDAIAGEMTDTQLNFLPAAIISWEEFKTSEPEGKVLSRETGYQRSYGRNPYTGYDDINSAPFLYDGPQTPGQLRPMARVLTVQVNQDAVAYPYAMLQDAHVVNDTVDDTPVVIFWAEGTASALDKSAIAQGADVGSATAFSRDLNGDVLIFSYDGENIIDNQTGSIWTPLGQAASGMLQGSQLESIVSINHFWFSWAAFMPDTRIYSKD